MREQLVTFETAVLAKEKGFIKYTNFRYMSKDVEGCLASIGDLTTLAGADISAPTQSLLQRWLREVHNIDVLVTSVKGYELTRYVSKIYRNKMRVKLVGHSLNYENTFEKGLQEGLKLIN